MIRCDGFGKLLKQGFFTLLISCFILLGNFSDSEWVIRQNGVYGNSTIDNTIDLNVVNKGQLMSQKFGNTQRMLAFSSFSGSRIYFWRSNNQIPYYLVNYRGYKKQGHLKNYLICDELTSGGSVTNCQVNSINDNFSIEVGGLFQSMTVNDLWGYDISTRNCYGDTYLRNRVCFSSSQYGKSICFYADGGDINYQGCDCTYCNTLQNSLGIDYNRDFTSINPSYLNNPPGFTPINAGNDLVGSENVSINNNISGDFIYGTCTYGEIISELEKHGFNNYMCYGGLDNFDSWDSSINYNAIPGTGKRLSQILSYSSVWDTPQEWFDYRNGLYGDDKFNAMWESYPAVYHTRFDFYYKYGNNKYFDSIREYCIVKADLSIDMNTVYRGNNSTFVGACDTHYDELRYGYDSSSGGVILGGNLDGFGSFSGVKVQNNPVVFIQDFFNKAKSSISTDFSQSILGFLPTYITAFLLALILFRFLMH